MPLYPPIRLGRMDEYAVAPGRMPAISGARVVVSRGGVRRLLGAAVERGGPALECRDADDLLRVLAALPSTPERERDAYVLRMSAARTMLAAGGSYKMKKLSVDAGFGYIYEGTRTADRGCVVTGMTGSMGCGPGGTEQAVPGWSTSGPYRIGPDPINPILNPDVQAEHPVNQGTYKSSYILVMLGVSTWF